MTNIAAVQKAIQNGNDGFFFSQNDSANREINNLLNTMAKQMDRTLQNAIEKSWKQGESDFWEELRSSYSGSKAQQKEFDLCEAGVRAHLNKTAQSFYNEKRNGFDLSDRVWNLAGNAKKEIEVILQNGIKEGKGADEIQKGLKEYLNEPDKLFRRVRNKETGELELSKAAQRYHPGQGVYRSAYKNTMRLARTEINAAYRRAAWESYQNNPLIVGYEIRLSNNPKRLKDICDELAGIYPKTFLWTGWHPQCLCHMIPIQISDEEFNERMRMRAAGTLDQWKPKNVVTKMPKVFDDWVMKNADRIAVAAKRGALPYFLKDNPTFAGISVNEMVNEFAVKIETNRKEYQRFLNDDNYTDVRFNPKNGALSAIHKDHQFDPTIGKFGLPRGNYERITLDVLYDYGRSAILGSERTPRGIQVPDGLLDGYKFEIKGIEGTGKNNIINNLKDANRKGAEAVILYYHDKNLFSEEQIQESYQSYLRNSKSKRIGYLYYIVDRKLYAVK